MAPQRPHRIMRWGRCGFACLLMLLAGPALACRADLRATVPLTRAGGLLLVPMSINDTVVDFVLDTGAERSVVGLAAADRLGLARDEWVSTDTQGAGGRDRRRLGRPRMLSLGGVALRRHTLAADNSVVVGPIPDAIAGRPVAGLLGQDFLSVFDLDLDPAAGMLRLYSVADCQGAIPGVFPPWPGHPVALPATRPIRSILLLPVRVAGQPMAAELDTGATLSMLMAPGMARLGLAAGGADHVRGFGSGTMAARRQDFTVQVGALPPGEVSLLISPVWSLRSVDMLLGADWATARRLWISWATDQVFVPG